ncbi:EAL domain-containing protein [Brevundimonas sp.]|uniref:EAL domain-containing protein n=1 Tax=Brevundimonas sp. TaxID=1871086 RepID=UPI00289F4F26|nr:EAL domain-containing protein [Brevundimonas sp.]
MESTFDQLTALKALGIQLLMDDFGVGYSSLSYFKRFPFDKVKIDKSFVDDIEQSQASRAVIAAVAGLGRALGMGIVAEGVETHAQRAELVALGCTHLQGYLFSRPLGVEDMMTFITAST